MAFTSPSAQYDRFMGRYTVGLAPALADVAEVRPGMRVLDVGCGPGGLTDELAGRVGSASVAAIDPAPQFAATCRERHPGADVRDGVAEDLPWPDGRFDATLSCLVLAFMADPDRGVREMVRVTRPGGAVVACMWDIAGDGMAMLATFWAAVRDVVSDAAGEDGLVGTSEGDIARRFTEAGLADVRATTITARGHYAGFDDFWEPFTFGVGPAGRYLGTLSDDERDRVRESCRATLPSGPFGLDARAWCARGTVASR